MDTHSVPETVRTSLLHASSMFQLRVRTGSTVHVGVATLIQTESSSGGGLTGD